MEPTKLSEYAAEKLKTGLSPELVKQHLLIVGWSEEEAAAAVFNGLVMAGVPTPQNKTRAGKGILVSTAELVLSFFSFILLGTVAVALGVLYYQVIAKYFPDPLVLGYGYPGYSSDAIHYATATLIIAFPIYLLIMRLWFRRFIENTERTESRLTKWLTYIVMLIAAVTIIGDLITAVNYLLGGELSPRFWLKVLTILTIAGLIFGFYFLERRKVQYKVEIPNKVFRAFGWVVSALVLLGIVLGFAATGSPVTERMRGLDVQRANALRNLSGCISNYGYEHKRLPVTLDELALGTYYACEGNMNDPETGVPYEYRVINPDTSVGLVHEGTYELCATFSLEASDAAPSPYTAPMIDKWSKHLAGRDCKTEVVVLDKGVETFVPGKPIPVNVR